MEIAKIGLYDSYLSTLGGGENFLAVLAEFLESEFPAAEIDILTYDEYQVPLQALEDRFDVSLRRTRIRTLRPRRRRWLARLHPIRRLLHEHDISKVSAAYDLFVNNTVYSLAPPRAPFSIYMCMFPLDPRPGWMRNTGLAARVLAPYARYRGRLYHRWLAGYSLLLANSEFTRGWIRRFWNLESRVLYPPISIRSVLDLSRKRRSIVGLGRFFPGDHNKKHDVLIDMLARIRGEAGGDWELHLVGGRTDVPGTDAYVERLERMAAGLPVHFHFDASRAELGRLLETSSLFWHATGFGEDEDERPEKLEHFGMSTVEAMTYGCVPVVYASGGQPEIVEPGRSGYLWRSLDEFRTGSLEVMRNRDAWERMARAAHAGSQRFSRHAFRLAVRALLAAELESGRQGRPRGVVEGWAPTG